jgi:Cytochrome P460
MGWVVRPRVLNEGPAGCKTRLRFAGGQFLRFADRQGSAACYDRRMSNVRFFFAGLLLLSPAAAAAPPTDEQLTDQVLRRAEVLEQVTTEPVLMPNEVALLCRKPEPEELAEVKGNPHVEKFSRLFVSKAGRPAAEGHETVHPEGTLLLKEKLPRKPGTQQAGDATELFTGMLKREAGYNPECGDWEFFTVSGDGKKVTARGKLASCMECHTRYADRDFTSRKLVPQRSAKPQADGSLLLHARDAFVFGRRLRYEPQPDKNTLGYWTVKEDTALWHMTVPPGRYEVEVLQGCGTGSGGAQVKLEFSGHLPAWREPILFTVEDTGHFQNFKPRTVGTLKVEKESMLTLRVTPQSKPGPAVMDLRHVVLRPVKP